jgi:hypothetical protein
MLNKMNEIKKTRAKFIQSDENRPIVNVYTGVNKEVVIANMEDGIYPFTTFYITFTPQQAILFAKHILKIAKEIQ